MHAPCVVQEPTLAAWRRLFGLPAANGSELYTHDHATRKNRGFLGLPTSTQMAIIDMSREDILLYRWARRKFDAQT